MTDLGKKMAHGIGLVTAAIFVGGMAWSVGFVALWVTARSPFGRPLTDVGSAFWISLPFVIVLPFTFVQSAASIARRPSGGALVAIGRSALTGALLAIIPIGLDLAFYSFGRFSRELLAMIVVFNVACGTVFCAALTAVLLTRWGARFGEG
jgi:hypothetical protein